MEDDPQGLAAYHLYGGRGIGPAALVSLGNINLGGSTTASSATAGGTITGDVGTGGSQSTATPNSSEFKVQLLDHTGNVLRDSAGNAITRGMTTDEYFIYYFGAFALLLRPLTLPILPKPWTANLKLRRQ